MRKVIGLLLLVAVASLAIFSVACGDSSKQTTVVGKVIDVQYPAGDRFTSVTIATKSGFEYYLGVPGKDPDLREGQTVEVTFKLTEYSYKFTRVVFVDGTIEYRDVSWNKDLRQEILKYKILDGAQE